MSKKKIVGIISGFVILNFVALMAISASVDWDSYCQDLWNNADSVVGTKSFLESNCLDDLAWLDENHPDRDVLELFEKEKPNETSSLIENLENLEP